MHTPLLNVSSLCRNVRVRVRIRRCGLKVLIWCGAINSALYAEILLRRLRVEIENGASKRKVLRLVEDYHDRATDAQGYKHLASRL